MVDGVTEVHAGISTTCCWPATTDLWGLAALDSGAFSVLPKCYRRALSRGWTLSTLVHTFVKSNDHGTPNPSLSPSPLSCTVLTPSRGECVIGIPRLSRPFGTPCVQRSCLDLEHPCFGCQDAHARAAKVGESVLQSLRTAFLHSRYCMADAAMGRCSSA